MGSNPMSTYYSTMKILTLVLQFLLCENLKDGNNFREIVEEKATTKIIEMDNKMGEKKRNRDGVQERQAHCSRPGMSAAFLCCLSNLFQVTIVLFQIAQLRGLQKSRSPFPAFGSPGCYG